jgi:hypothetical protein
MLTPLKREVVAEEQRGLIEEEVEPTSTGLHWISQQWKSGRIKWVGQIVRYYVASCVRRNLIPAVVLQPHTASVVRKYFT